MNTALWIVQGVLAVTFAYSGWMKSTLPIPRLVAIGQTGVADLSLPLVRFIGVSELLGAVGLILPRWTGILPTLTPLSALCLGLIMIPAAIIHYKRREVKTVWRINVPLFLLCLLVAYGRQA